MRCVKPAIAIRPAEPRDADDIWAALEPIIRGGEYYALPRDLPRDGGLAYWLAPEHDVFVAIANETVVGSYFVRANQRGGGAHVANAGYLTAAHARGTGVARALCAHSLDHARSRGFRAMQFNFVVATNEPAVHLWQAMGFAIIGRIPGGFVHATLGEVDALIMHRLL